MAIHRKHRKQASLSVRVTAQERSKFHAKSGPYGGASEVLRELLVAFIEDRVIIQPPVIKGPLYVSRTED
jgi:hypothetical protein